MEPGSGISYEKQPAGAQAGEVLLPLLYDELRKLAAARMAAESQTGTLQPTALVHEAWLRLSRPGQPQWASRAHFFAAAAECMRRILIDRARRRRAEKRGSGRPPIDLHDIDLAAEVDDESLLRVDEALQKLADVDPQSAELIKVRFFTGMNYKEAAEWLNVSERTAKRLWTFGRSWLYQELSRNRAA